MDKRVLLVDNDPRFLQSLADILNMNRYCVYSAKSPEEALSILKRERIHLAVIDVRLRNDNNLEDTSGLDLARTLASQYPQIVRLFLTGYKVAAVVADIRNPNDPDGVELGEIVLFKDLDPDELLSRISNAFERKVRINHDLEISFESELSLESCLNLLSEPFALNSEFQAKFAEELEELFRRLFRQEKKIRFYRMPQGLSTAGLVRVDVEFAHGPGNSVIVKFDLRPDPPHLDLPIERLRPIQLEVEKYNDFVQRHIVGNRETILEFYSRTMNLEGIVYSFEGTKDGMLPTFNEYYVKNLGTSISIFIKNLFETLNHWFEAHVDPCAIPLGQFYLQHLSLDRRGKRESLSQTARRVMQEPSATKYFRTEWIGEEWIEISFADGERARLPNPITFAYQYTDLGSAGARQVICHGDLNGSNMFVDDSNYPRLIDFAHTGYGPVMTDFAKLESVIKFELLQSEDLTTLWKMEKCLIAYNNLSSRFSDSNIQKALQSIRAIRSELEKRAGSEEPSNYDIALFYNTVKRIGWPPSTSIAEPQISAFSQAHAFLAAALLAAKLTLNKSGIEIPPPSPECLDSSRGHRIPAQDPLLVKRLKEGRAGLFVGAGVSINSGLPNWKQLFQPILAELGLNDDGSNYPAIAQAYVDRYRTRLLIVSHIVEKLKNSTATPSEIHRLLAKLPFQIMITTNYDELLESVFPKDKYRHVIADSEIALHDSRRDVIYLHGSISDTNRMVITSNDFYDYADTHPKITHRLQELLQEYTFVFVGYSFSDPHLRQILHHFAKVNDDLRQVHFALMLHDDPVLFNEMRRLSIIPINLDVPDPADPVELETYLNEIIEALAGG